MAIGSQLAMLIYFTVDNHVDLYPWNNLRSPVAELPGHTRCLVAVSFDHVGIRFSRPPGHGRGNNLRVRMATVTNQAVVDSLSVRAHSAAP